jgi:hypothetical protein
MYSISECKVPSEYDRIGLIAENIRLIFGQIELGPIITLSPVYL